MGKALCYISPFLPKPSALHVLSVKYLSGSNGIHLEIHDKTRFAIFLL